MRIRRAAPAVLLACGLVLGAPALVACGDEVVGTDSDAPERAPDSTEDVDDDTEGDPDGPIGRDEEDSNDEDDEDDG